MTDISLRYRDISVPGATGYGRQTECPTQPVRLRGVEVRDDFVYINYEPVKNSD